MTVDLTYSASPLLPILPVVHFTGGQEEEIFFYTAVAPAENHLSYSFGNPIDYRSAQAGTPQVSNNKNIYIYNF